MLTSWDAGRNMPVQQRVDILQYAKAVIAFSRGWNLNPVPYDPNYHSRCHECGCPLLPGHFVLTMTPDGYGEADRFFCFECLEYDFLQTNPNVTPPEGIEKFRDRGQFYTVEGVGR